MPSLSVKVEEAAGYEVAVIRLGKRYTFLSSTVRGGGLVKADTAIVIQVPPDYSSRSPERDAERVCASLGLHGDVICFMTAAEIRRVLVSVRESVGRAEAAAIATAGLDHGTINVLAVVDVPLALPGLVNAVMTATEAKAEALAEEGFELTGTSTDAIAVGAPHGDGKYAGRATEVGSAILKAVSRAVRGSLRRSGARPHPIGVEGVLGRLGLSLEDLWDAAKRLYVPAPGWKEDTVKTMFLDTLRALAGDVNVNALVATAYLLDRAARRGLLAGLSSEEYVSDPVHLLADEIIGMMLAEYVAGTRGLFEYARYDRAKPGVIGNLGPFLDDAIAALVGAAMSSVYTRLLGGV